MRRAIVPYRSALEDNARWDAVTFRPGDIVISTPAKCGTTWTQMICALLVFGTPHLPATLDELSPFVDLQSCDVAELVAKLEAQTHRRFLKTHTPLNGLPWHDEVTYITVGRDPRDVALSTVNHDDNKDQAEVRRLMRGVDDPTSKASSTARDDGVDGGSGSEAGDQLIDRFWRWMESPSTLAGLLGTVDHLEGFWRLRDEPGIVMLHYDDLRADLAGRMRWLADRLGTTIPEESWPDLVEAATFERMRDRAEELAPSPTLWRDRARFFHRGTSGQWADLLDAADRARYARLVERLCPPDFAAWLHREPLL